MVLWNLRCHNGLANILYYVGSLYGEPDEILSLDLVSTDVIVSLHEVIPACLMVFASYFCWLRNKPHAWWVTARPKKRASESFIENSEERSDIIYWRITSDVAIRMIVNIKENVCHAISFSINK